MRYTSLAFILLNLYILLPQKSHGVGFSKEYYEITDINKRKEMFFSYLYPLIEKENKKILKEREFVKAILSKDKSQIDVKSKDFAKLLKIKKRYKIKNTYELNKYLRAIDIIPVSLVLAQAAIESGWGKSRFIKEANNIFGQWTYTGKGLVPLKRDNGAKHKIKIFSSLQHAIRAYMINLNIGWAYKEFRKRRENIRKKGYILTGLELSKTLIKYSQLREKYIRIVRKIIKHNNLERYDTIAYKQAMLY